MTQAQQPEALEDFKLRKMAALGPVHASSGLVERRPAEYRRELEDQFVRGFRAAESRQRARIKELEAQLYAIGAGGVEPLRKCLHQIAEPAQAAPATVTLMTEDQASKWAWDRVRQDVGTDGWTTGDSCNFFGFFLHGWNYRGQYELQRRAALAAAPQPQVAAQEPKRVFLVATGELHEGEETYTRHDDAPPPLCDAECLYTHPAPQPAQGDALTEIVGCLDAANAEGLDDALVNNTDARLADLVQRRLLPAFYVAIAAQAAQQLPERDASVSAEQQGLFHKFDVRRVDGSDQPGGKHHGCRYFVLDVDHDPCARAALTAYAAACEATHPALAADLRTKWGAMPTTQAAPVAQGDALTDTYVQQVPDKCDRIVWRGRYYHLPIDAAEHSYTEPSPMAKVAAALRQKAEQEDAAYQARRSDQGLMESEWGPMEDAPPHEDPPMHVAVVEGDDTVRTLQWNRDVAAFAYPAGTLLYAARSQAKKGGAA